MKKVAQAGMRALSELPGLSVLFPGVEARELETKVGGLLAAATG